jgi:hypothetical protein
MKLSSKIRLVAGLHPNDRAPISIIPGDSQPKEVGESWSYVTKTGKPIHHPSAYSRKGWSSMVYKSSTRRVEVGEDWVLNHKM